MRYRFFTVLVLLVCCLTANAGLVISGRRVIYDERIGETSVLIRKTTGDVPALMQVWLDDGHPEANPQQLNVPFLITPVVSRIEFGHGQSVRIIRTGGGLPEDRESVFWFNVQEAPALQQVDTEDNPLMFSSRARMPFFYRPRGIKGISEEAHQALRFTMENGSDGRIQLRVRNGSPFYVTFRTLDLRSGSGDGAAILAQMNQDTLNRMVDPMGELVVPLDMVATSGRQALSGARVHYGVVNDYGGNIEGERGFN